MALVAVFCYIKIIYKTCNYVQLKYKKLKKQYTFINMCVLFELVELLVSLLYGTLLFSLDIISHRDNVIIVI